MTARTEWEVVVDPQTNAGAAHTVIAFEFAALQIKVAVNCTLGEVIVRVPGGRPNVFINAEADPGNGSGRPNWSDP